VGAADVERGSEIVEGEDPGALLPEAFEDLRIARQHARSLSCRSDSRDLKKPTCRRRFATRRSESSRRELRTPELDPFTPRRYPSHPCESGGTGRRAGFRNLWVTP